MQSIKCEKLPLRIRIIVLRYPTSRSNLLIPAFFYVEVSHILTESLQSPAKICSKVIGYENINFGYYSLQT